MPFMTVAENIWIRREPKNRFGFIDHGEMHRKTQALFDRLNIDIDPEIEVRELSRRQPPDGRDRQGGVLRVRRPDHGRADLGADRDARSRISSRSSATCAGAGQRHRLHHPQDERAVRDRRRGLGLPRRQVYRHPRLQRRDPRRHHPHDGRPRDHPDVSRRRRCRSARSCCRSRTSASTASSTTSRFDVRAGEILGIAGLVGSGRSNVAETIFGVTPATSRHDRDPRPAGRHRLARAPP